MLISFDVFSCTICFRHLDVVYRVTLFFFFNDTAPTEIYTLSLHDALPIHLYDALRYGIMSRPRFSIFDYDPMGRPSSSMPMADRKSTRLNSSHGYISYAVFCLKKKKKKKVRSKLNVSKKHVGRITQWNMTIMAPTQNRSVR